MSNVYGRVLGTVLLLFFLGLSLRKKRKRKRKRKRENRVMTKTEIFCRMVAELVLTVLSSGVLTGLREELTDRWFMLRSLTMFCPTSIALVLSSADFALTHFEPQRLRGLFAAGLVLGAGYIITEDISCPIAAHALWNSLVFAARILGQYQQDISNNRCRKPTLLQMAVCQTYGDKGFSNLFVNCAQCQVVAVHRYCVDGPPIIEAEGIKWLCKDCDPGKAKPVSPCRKSERLCSILRRDAERKQARKKWKNSLSPAKDDSNCVGKEAGEETNLDHNTKIDSGRREHVKLTETESVLRSDDFEENGSSSVERKGNSSVLQHVDYYAHPSNDTSNNTHEIVEGGRHSGQAKGLVDSGKGSPESGQLRSQKTKDSNLDIDEKFRSPEPFHLTEHNTEDVNSKGAHGDQHAKPEKNVVPLVSTEEDHISHSLSISGASINGDLDLDKDKHEESSDEIHSELIEGSDKSENSHRNGKQPAQADDKISEVIEKTVADSILDQQGDVQSRSNSIESQTPRKRRRVVIEMDLSGEEPVVVMANHPQLIVDSGKNPLHMTSQDPPGVSNDYGHADRSLFKSVSPRPSREKADCHALTQENRMAVGNRVLARPCPVNLDNHVRAQPLIDAVWRGSCSISDYEDPVHFALEAHLSNKAHEKVHGAAMVLPSSLHFELVPKNDAWPKSFVESPPTGDAIGLYFFPVNDRDEKLYENLIDDMIEHGLAVRSSINNLELLVFCSRELPQEEWGFNRKYYLWGVFKPRREKLSNLSGVQACTDQFSVPSGFSSDKLYRKKDLSITAAPTTSYSVSQSSIDGQNRYSLLNPSDSYVCPKGADDIVEATQLLSRRPTMTVYEKRGLGESCNSHVQDCSGGDVDVTCRAMEQDRYFTEYGNSRVAESSYHANNQGHYTLEPKSRRDVEFSHREQHFGNRNQTTRREFKSSHQARNRRGYWKDRDHNNPRGSWKRPRKNWKRGFRHP